MIYQYIFGRTSSGYETIFSNDKGKYLNDKKIVNCLDFEFIKPDNLDINICPKPIIFINNPNNREIVAIGRAKQISSLRNSNLYHFYIYDELEKNNFYENISDFLLGANFIEEKEEINDTNIIFNNKNDIPNLKEIGEFLNLNDKNIKYILFSFFETISSNKTLFIINKESNEKSVLFNLYLLECLFKIISPKIIKYLGFITYFKYIKPSDTAALNLNIKIRFVENNKDNLEEIKETEEKGNYILNCSNNYFTNQQIFSRFLDFLEEGLKDDSKKAKILEFNSFFENSIVDFSKLNFSLIENIFNIYNNFFKDETEEFNFFINYIDNYNILSDGFKNYSDDFIKMKISNYIDNIKNPDQIFYIFNKFKEFKLYILDLLATKITFDSNPDKYFNYLTNKNVTKTVLYELRNYLLLNESYENGARLFFDFLTKRVLKNRVDEILIQETDILIQFASIKENFFNKFDMDNFFENIISKQLLKIDLNSLKQFLEDINNIILIIKDENIKEKFINLYKKSSFYYLVNNINFLIKEDEKHIFILEKFFEITEIINLKINLLKEDFYIKNFKNLMNNILTEQFIDLDNFLVHLDFIYKNLENIKKSDELKKIINYILKSLFVNFDCDKSKIEKISKWPKEYIILIENEELSNKVFCQNVKKQFQKSIDLNNFDQIKDILKFQIEYDEFSDLTKEILTTAEKWISDNVLKNNKFDFLILTYIYKDNLVNILDKLPSDNINAWVHVLKHIRKEVYPINNKFDAKIIEIISNNKKLLNSFSQLPETEQKLFANEINLLLKPKIKSNIFDLSETFLGFMFNIVLLYFIIIIINNLKITKEVLSTALIFSIGIIISYLLLIKGVSKLKKQGIKIFFLFFQLFIILGLNIYFVNIDEPNNKNSILNVYKNIFFIKYDIESPTLEILEIEKYNPVNSEKNNVDLESEKFEFNEDEQIKIIISNKDNNEIEKTQAFFDSNEIAIENNTILINLKNFPIDDHVLKIITHDTFGNEAKKDVLIKSIKVNKEINFLSGYYLGNPDEAGDYVTLPNDSNLEIRKKEVLKVKILSQSNLPSELSIFFNNKMVDFNLNQTEFVVGYDDFEVGKNVLIIISKNYYTTKAFYINIDKIVE